jgi:ribosomal protein L11 methylase PrmA
VLIELATAVAGAVGEGGHLVLGGLLVDQVPAVAAAYGRSGHGLRVVSTEQEDGWATLLLGR